MAKNPTLSAEDIAQLIEDYVNEMGQWPTFKKWLKEKGYDVEELGIEDE